MTASVELLSRSTDGTIECYRDEVSEVVIIEVSPPGGQEPLSRLISTAATLGFAGRLDCLALDEDGTEGWSLSPGDSP